MINVIQNFDEKVFALLNSYVGVSPGMDKIWSIIAVYFVYLVPLSLIIVWFAFPRLRESVLRAFLGAIIAWQVFARIIGALWFRARPFARLDLPSKELIFHRPDYSFPSDHATMVAGIAFGFFFQGRKGAGWFFLFWGIIFSFARVVTGLHWLSDIVGGFALGALIAWLINFKLWRKCLDRFYTRPLIKLARLLRLAP